MNALFQNPISAANCACGGFALALYLFALPSRFLPFKALLFASFLFAAFCLLLPKRRAGLFLIVFCGAFCLGAWRCYLLPQPQTAKLPFGKIVTISGKIAQMPTVKSDPKGTVVTYLLKEATIDGKRQAASFYLSTRTSAPFGCGDIITGKGRLRPVSALSNFHSPYPLFLLRDNIQGRLFCPRAHRCQIGTAPFERFNKALFAFRQHFRAFLEKRHGKETAAVLFSLLFGGYEKLSAKTIDDFAATGLIHILSVSGSHITLLAGAVIYLGKKLRLPLFCQFLLLFTCIFVYGALAGFSPPVLRAGLLGLLSFGALILRREASARYLLALVFCALLAFEPLLLFDIGFELSFSATAGLIYLFSPLCRLLPNLYFPLRAILAATLAAQIACLPFLAHYFGTFPLSSFLSCPLAGPILEMIIVIAMGLAALFALSPALCALPFSLCAALAKMALAEIHLLAALPFAQVFVPAFSPVGLIAFSLLLLLLASAPARQKMRQLCQEKRLLPHFALFYALLLFLFCLAPARAAIYFFDVGQGDAALIISPQRKAALIDTGGLRGREDFIAQRVILPQLKRLGVKELSYLFLSHPHADHASAVPKIAESVPIGRIIVGGSPKAYAALWKKAPSEPIIKRLHCPKAGETFPLGDICLTVLDPGEKEPQSDQNEASLLLAAQYKGHRLLFTGDLTPQAEKRAVKNLGEKLRCDILKVAHHGSPTSSTPAFIDACKMRLGVISVGADNDYNHPARRVISLLEKKRAHVLRTDRCGAVRIFLCGKKRLIKNCAEAKKLTAHAA